MTCFDYRFVQREVDPATLSAIEDKINKEKSKMEKMAAKATERQNSATSNSQEIEPSVKTGSEIVKETSNTNISMETDSNSVSQSDSRSEVKGSAAEQPMDIDDTKVVSSSSEPMGDKDTSSKRKREGSSDGGGQLSTSGGQLGTSGGQLSSSGGQLGTSGGQTSAQGGIEVIPPGSNEDLPPALRGVSVLHILLFFGQS